VITKLQDLWAEESKYYVSHLLRMRACFLPGHYKGWNCC